ncbi:hypothetical protein BMS3Abin05_02521 [bacterium BMS3Abin05]|nr:hypothetical protein BMS3Abin05_02521 [bacterium BMS3Abin05]
METVHQFLGAPHRESRYDDFPAAANRFIDHLCQFPVDIFDGMVVTPAVSAFNDQIIRFVHMSRIPENGKVFSPEIPGKKNAPFFTVFLNIHHDLSRAQNVPGIHKSHTGGGVHEKRPVVSPGDKIHKRFTGIFRCVNRLNGGKSLLFVFFVDIFHIFFLDVGRVPQHNGAQIARGKRAENIAVVTGFNKIRNIAAVIDVSVCQDHVSNRFCVKRQSTVLFFRLFSMSLVQSAIDQKCFIVCMKKMHGAGYGLNRTHKL